MNANYPQTMRERAPEARRWLVAGRVQGVGFRPFVFRLATQFALVGRVQNLAGQVLIEAEGRSSALDAFTRALIQEAPPLAMPQILSCETIPQIGGKHFEIALSASDTHIDIHVPPDYFLCDDCRDEMQDPRDRRYRYPFINCTQCGPRYSLIDRLPYDRPNTTMAGFELCPACCSEYANPLDRRFHAEPVACPVCGPVLRFVTASDQVADDAALEATVSALVRGEIVAVKGVGGYHLMCDATNDTTVARLRANKPRPHKPLALMFPWRGADGLECVRQELEIDAATQTALSDPARPIVLARRRADSNLPDLIAPGLNELGAMLPYSPLHHLLLDMFGKPVVATSANVSGEPVLTENIEAETRLGRVAQAFLHHNRPIARPAEDTVVRVIAGRPRLLRAGRGIAPIELDLPCPLAQPLLAVGGHMKNTIALGWGNRAVLSPHIGDLDTPRSLAVFDRVIADLQRLYGVTPQTIVCDAHPGYASSRWATRTSLPIIRVWHHQAHASALASQRADKTWLMFTWDGVGLGEDGMLWGGEALHGRPGRWRRVVRMRPFRLPGGERAGREPWRSAVALSWEIGCDWPCPSHDAALFKHAWEKGLNAPSTTAVGRLFDGAASLLGLVDRTSYEGQGPMLLEAAARGDAEEVVELPLYEEASGLITADWAPLVRALMWGDVPVAQRAMQFHLSLARSILDQAERIRALSPFDIVGLSGGVFQNKLLTEMAVQQLEAAGFDVHLSLNVPCNDGGLAFGQLMEAGFANG